MTTRSLSNALRWAQSKLSLTSDSPQLDAELLLSHVCHCSRTHLYTWPEQALPSEQDFEFTQLVKKRTQGEPIAYLIGEQAFWSLTLKVNKSTLIPRPETELLVELCLDQLDDVPDLKVLDLGTGSGAIALALATERPKWQITATDKCKQALKIAIQNAQSLNINNVAFKHSHWFENLAPEKFDAIVSNPPYIDINDTHTQKSVRQHEPHAALFSADNGLEDIKAILEYAPNFMKKNGFIAIEHGFHQAKVLKCLMNRLNYRQVVDYKDINDLDRIITGRS